ncbi:SPX domain-containing protein [Rhodotorula diobovata]|uniref:SPX domain-containing protein n=1 Tax=Rhodotorula diobovata TaxID=5288 RepID=A0A5C5G342_9BASI|nr:SPX domain-containing protein [Rhodotorula diobovata]
MPPTLSTLFRILHPGTPSLSTDTQPDVELQPLRNPPPESTQTRSSLARPRPSVVRSPAKMKFSHSLLFNAVPEWTNHYLAYDALKAQIYKFEKQAVLAQGQTGPATQYRDEEEGGAEPLAGQAELSSSHANERTFIKLLDKELHKITEFYVDKERELLGDLVLLKEDLERLREEEDADLSLADSVSSSRPRRPSGSFGNAVRNKPSNIGATSGGSDSEGDEEDEDDADTRKKGAFAKILNDPREYAEASRAGRKSARRASVGGKGKTAAKPGRRARALSSASETGDLLELHEADGEEDEDEEEEGDDEEESRTRRPAGAQQPARAGFAPPARRPTMSKQRGLSRLSNSLLTTEEEGLMSGATGGAVWEGLSDWAIDTRIMYKRRLAGLFTTLSELKQYVDLNYTGLSKVLKKFDKITNSSLRQHYMTTVVDHTFPFERATQQRLQAGIQSIIPLYADLATGGDVDLALKQLKAHLREHVVWERNTVWREMIGLERRGWSASGGYTGAGGRSGASAGATTGLPVVQPPSPPSGLELKPAEISTPLGKLRLPSWINGQTVPAAVALLLFGVILSCQWFDRVEEQNCLALLVVVTIFWALEIMPLFVTALMVPFLVVILRVLRSTDGEDRRLTSVEATKFIFGQMFSPTIMLLLGGFTLAAALSKQNIDKVLATKVLSLAGTRPRSILFAYMLVACFASMWISNVAAPVLCYSLIQPILRTLPSKSPFSKALILGIALASNVGGMASPISSPQNLIALDYMNPPISWLAWFSVSIPVSFLSVCLIWGILLWTYRAGTSTVAINPVRVTKEPFTSTQWWVSGVTIATILLWCVETKLAWLFGDMGIIAILPIVAFYGSGVLRKADFDHSPWSIVTLAMGGIALGKAVLSSGLLDDIDGVIQQVVLGMDIWPILALFSVIVLVIGTFISHTIAAVLVVPIAAQIGAAMETPHPRLLIFATSLVCSAGMALPISGFPNLAAANQEDELGQRYLYPSDFYRNGVPASIGATAVIITIGYAVMRLLGL